tara:strand:+ start:1306 stop:3321 length:2016 start_codon:yes stop_codon:yes gene_type:complete
MAAEEIPSMEMEALEMGDAATADTPSTGSAGGYITIGKDVYDITDEGLNPSTGLALAGSTIGMYFGGSLGAAAGSYIGSMLGGLFGGGHTSSAYRQSRLMAAFSATASTKNAYNTSRINQSKVTDQGVELDFISGKNRYHQREDIFWQAQSILITAGNPNGLWDIEHRSPQELINNMKSVQLGEPGGMYLTNPAITRSATESIYGYLLEFDSAKAAEFRSLANSSRDTYVVGMGGDFDTIDFIHANPEYGNAIKNEIALRREEGDISSGTFGHDSSAFNLSQIVRNEFTSRQDDIMEVINNRDLSLDEIQHANQIREIFNRTLFIPSAELQAQIDHRERLMDMATEARGNAVNSIGLWQEAADAITEALQDKLSELTGLETEIGSADVLEIRHLNEQLEKQALLNLEIEAGEIEKDFLVDSAANLQNQSESIAHTLNEIEGLSITDELNQTQEALENYSQQLQNQIDTYNQSHITLQDEFKGVINEFNNSLDIIIGDGLNFDNLAFLTLGVTIGKRLLNEGRDSGSIDDTEYKTKLGELDARQAEIDQRIIDDTAARGDIADRVVKGLETTQGQVKELRLRLPDLELPELNQQLQGEPNLPGLDPVSISIGQSLAQQEAPIVQQPQEPDIGEFLGQPEVETITGNITKASTVADILGQREDKIKQASNIFG